MEQWRRSGLSQAAFCRQRGIPDGSLSFWKYRLSGSAPASGKATSGSKTRTGVPVLLPVRITEGRPESLASPSLGGEVEIDLGRGRLVRVEASWLADVLQVVEAARC